MRLLQKRSVRRTFAVLPVAAALAGVSLLLAGSFVTFALSQRGASSSPSGATSALAKKMGRATTDALNGPGRLLTANSANLPADCIPKPSGPPGAPYQLGVVGTVNDGLLTAGSATIANVTAKFCGIVTVVGAKPPCGATGNVVSPQDGQIFGSLSAELTLVPGMQPKVPFVAHPGTITGTFTCTSNSSAGLAVSLTAKVSGSTGLFGLSCTIGPLTIPLTGLVTGPLDNATVTLRSNDFAVPAVQSSPSCAGAVPANLDQIAGLPIRPGGATATLPATTSIYQPGP
jgi:hypothetical protein